MNGLRPAAGVFLILLGSYSYFWHARDWNASSRLMLTYSLVDRGQVSIDGLEDHTRDRAKVGDRYYSEKNPGYSLLAIPSYALGKSVFGLPPHPLGRKGPEMPYWPADYLVTLGTSGVLSALCGAILTGMAVGLGCGPRRAVLVGLCYGLATPAYVYATLSYGHQATACLLMASFAAIERARKPVLPEDLAGEKSLRPDRTRTIGLSSLSGVCAAGAAVVELQVGPVSAVLGAYFLALVLAKRLPLSGLAAFALGAAGPTAVLLVYNTIAFGSPFDMGYFHLEMEQFRAVHSEDNPLGLRRIAWGRTAELLWGEHRGLLLFAPILLLAVPGWVVLAIRRAWGMFLVSLGACLAVFLVNLSYPEWTGGWSTGPRLLVPLLPFAMLPVAALLACDRLAIAAVAVALALAGGVEMLMFQAIGGRVPQAPEDARIDTPNRYPWRRVVLPLWMGEPVPPWKEGARFDRTIAGRRWPEAFRRLPVGWRWVEFLPLVVGQSLAIGALMVALRPGRHPSSKAPTS